MSFQMIRRSAKFEISWNSVFVVESYTNSDKQDIGNFYCKNKVPLYHQPNGGTFEDCIFNIDRWIKHQQELGDIELSLKASTIIRLKEDNQIIAVCLINTDTPDHIKKVFHPFASIQMMDVDPKWRRKGIGTSMIKRAMTIVCDKRPAFDLWVEENNKSAINLFEKLDFVFTGLED
jgi:ribosomal protein S18 acetylase RimI-like enzyme